MMKKTCVLGHSRLSFTGYCIFDYTLLKVSGCLWDWPW